MNENCVFDATFISKVGNDQNLKPLKSSDYERTVKEAPSIMKSKTMDQFMAIEKKDLQNFFKKEEIDINDIKIKLNIMSHPKNEPYSCKVK